MEEVEYQRMCEAEQRSWWFRGRRQILAGVLGRLSLPSSTHIADIGCGTGGNLPMLMTFGEVVGFEPSLAAARLARQNTCARIVIGSATSLKGQAFDLVTMFDVLEHLDDDRVSLAEVRRLLRPGGYFLFTVPAFMFLWSGHDEALHHKRRYRRAEIQRRLEEATLQVRWITYYNTALFPVVAAIRLLRRMIGGGERRADVAKGVPWLISVALETIFAAERHLVDRVRLPFGLSLMGLATAPLTDSKFGSKPSGTV